MAKNKLPDTKPKRPPEKTSKSIQFDLFGKFLSNNPDEVSNTIEIWESIPKYFFTPTLMDKLRSEDGLAKPYTWEYTHRRNNETLSYRVEIQPALIKQDSGGYLAVFPSASEEMIEEVLKKLLLEQNLGVHDPDKVESWVRFTLSMIHKELKSRGRERNRTQIKRSLDIMSQTFIKVFCEDKELYRGPILSDVFFVDREAYLEDADTLWSARLPALLSLGINEMVYRQYNYGRFWVCDEQLSRWIYKRLVNRFIQAGEGAEYSILYSEIKQSSGMLQMKSEQGNRRKVESSLEELKSSCVLASYKINHAQDGKKILDTKYTLIAGDEFIKEQKAANKRKNDNHISALNSGLTWNSK